jgi:hypothetical protein
MFFSASSTEEYFTDINIPYDTEFLLVQCVGRNAELSLTEVYQDHPSRDLQRHSVANWSSASGFLWSPTSLLNRRGNLHGTVVRVGVPGEVSAASSVINTLTGQVCRLNKIYSFCVQVFSAVSSKCRYQIPFCRTSYEIWNILQQGINFK